MVLDFGREMNSFYALIDKVATLLVFVRAALPSVLCLCLPLCEYVCVCVCVGYAKWSLERSFV
jgi:hypothetical protein